MNKNYKENIRKRVKEENRIQHKSFKHAKKENKKNLRNTNKQEEKQTKVRRIDYKEYIVKRNSTLLDYLINDLGFSRTNAKALLSHHVVSIEGAPVSQFDFELSKGDVLIISKNPIRTKSRKNIPIIYEDDEFLVINKPYGLLTNPSDTEKNSTAVRMVMDYMQSFDKHNRIYLVHRIDKETSGVLMFCKNEKIRDLLMDDWNNLVIKRGYFAIVEGQMEEKEKTIVNYLRKNKLDMMYVVPHGGQGSYRAVTSYKVLKENKKYSLLDVNISTGRKNQIRVTLGSLGHYVLGDDKYGEPENPINRLCLHAYELSFRHPITGKIYKFDAPTPKEFLKLMEGTRWLNLYLKNF